MKLISFLLLIATGSASVMAAETEAERHAISVLQSSTPLAQKEAACLRLKEAGTASSVPDLTNLLADESLAQWALDALETLPVPEAGDALLGALPRVSGKTQAGVIHALGLRRDARAVTDLAALLAGSEEMLAVTAARALGRVANREALVALQTARAGAGGRKRGFINDALLAAAEQLLAEGQRDAAVIVYESLRSADETPLLRMAAFQGVLTCGPDEQRTSLVLAALTGQDDSERWAAIQFVREGPGTAATVAIADSLDRVPAEARLALIEALRQRNDPAVAEAMSRLVRHGDSSVRIAALKALGELGSEREVALLAGVAASTAGEERSAARAALVSLHRGDVLTTMLLEIGRAPSETKVELVQAMARRVERGAVPALLRLAGEADEQVALAATQALEKLADDSHRQQLLGLLVQSATPARREAAVEAFVAAGLRSHQPQIFSTAALESLTGASTDARCALLSAAGQIGGPGVIESLRLALREDDSRLVEASLRTLADHAGDEARPDLLRFALMAKSESQRAIALDGYWRLVEAMQQQSSSDRLAAVQSGLGAARTPAERKLGLARLAELPIPAALELAETFRGDTTVRAEAEVACLQIASRLEAAHMEEAVSALRKLAESAENPRVRNESRSLLTALEAHRDYLSPWLVSGPYRQAGKEAQQLFEMAFAPESDAPRAAWRPLPGGSLTNHWLADLAPVVGGDHCVVYLKTTVFSPKEQTVLLEIGSDDGVKLWINGDLVHANNAVRGFTAGEDKAKGMLKEGWNEFLMKITQHTLGCAAAIRVRAADGGALTGLRASVTR